MAESTVRHWDALWVLHKAEPVHERSLKDMIRLYGRSLKGKKVLEAGAGSAIDSIVFTKMTGCKPYCLDYSTKSIAFIKKNFKKNKLKGNYIKADIRKIPSKNNTFDIIFSHGVLEHFKEPQKIIAEQKRILKKNGLLVIGVPETYSLYTIKKHIQMLFGTWFAGWETQYSKCQMRKMAEKEGLIVKEIIVYGNAPLWFPQWMKNVCNVLRLSRIIASDVVLYATKK